MRVADLEKAAPRQIIAAQLQASNSNGQSAACVCVGEEIETFDENTLRYNYAQLHANRLFPLQTPSPFPNHIPHICNTTSPCTPTNTLMNV